MLKNIFFVCVLSKLCSATIFFDLIDDVLHICTVAMKQIQTNPNIEYGGRIAFPIVQITYALFLQFIQYTKSDARASDR